MNEALYFTDYAKYADQYKDTLDTFKKAFSSYLKKGTRKNEFLESIIVLPHDDKIKIEEEILADSTLKDNLVGWFRFRTDETEYEVKIGSRFDNEKEPYFVRYMLEKTDHLRFLVPDYFYHEAPSDIKDYLNDLVALNFLDELTNMLRKGTIREYRTFEHNDAKIRGSIDIPRHIRLNLVSPGRIAYNSREYTQNAVKIIKREFPGIFEYYVSHHPDFMNQLNILSYNITWDFRGSDILKRTEKPVRNTHLRGYEKVRHLARWIVRQYGLGRGDDEKYRTMGVLVDINKLWEKFVEEVIFNEIDELKSGKYAQQEFDILEPKQKGKKQEDKVGRSIKPDFSWKDQGLVVDAKNKPVYEKRPLKGKWTDEENSFKYDALREDVLQLLAYMGVLRCRKGGFIFPTNEGKYDEQDLARTVSQDAPEFGKIYLLPFTVPGKNNGSPEQNKSEEEGYEYFKERIEVSENKIQQFIRDNVIKDP